MSGPHSGETLQHVHAIMHAGTHGAMHAVGHAVLHSVVQAAMHASLRWHCGCFCVMWTSLGRHRRFRARTRPNSLYTAPTWSICSVLASSVLHCLAQPCPISDEFGVVLSKFGPGSTSAIFGSSPVAAQALPGFGQHRANSATAGSCLSKMPPDRFVSNDDPGRGRCGGALYSMEHRVSYLEGDWSCPHDEHTPIPALVHRFRDVGYIFVSEFTDSSSRSWRIRGREWRALSGAVIRKGHTADQLWMGFGFRLVGEIGRAWPEMGHILCDFVRNWLCFGQYRLGTLMSVKGRRRHLRSRSTMRSWEPRENGRLLSSRPPGAAPKCDEELAVRSVQEDVKRRREPPTIVDHSGVEFSQDSGAAGSVAQTLGEQVRGLRQGLEAI